MSTVKEQNKPLLIHVATVARSFFYASQIGQIRYMKMHGFDVMVAAHPDEMLDRFASACGIQSLSIRMKRAVTPIQDIKSIWDIWREFRRLKPEIVHAHTPKGGLVAMMGAFLAGVKIRLYHLHGLRHLTARGLTRKFLLLSDWISCSLAHRVYFVSHSILDIAVEEGLCSPQKAKVLCNGSINGVDALIKYNPKSHDRGAIRARIKIPQNAIVIGFVGRVVNDKGIRELMQAWGQLREKFSDTYLVVVGPMEETYSISSTLKLRILEDKRVRYIGEVDDTSSFYAVMDILAFPTYREGFGLVAIEASAMEIPVIATKIPGVVDAVIDEVTGVLIPPGDASALQEAIERYLCQPKTRCDHGRNGRKRVLADFRPEAIWEAQHAEYLELLSSKGSPGMSERQR